MFTILCGCVGTVFGVFGIIATVVENSIMISIAASVLLANIVLGIISQGATLISLILEAIVIIMAFLFICLIRRKSDVEEPLPVMQVERNQEVGKKLARDINANIKTNNRTNERISDRNNNAREFRPFSRQSLQKEEIRTTTVERHYKIDDKNDIRYTNPRVLEEIARYSEDCLKLNPQTNADLNNKSAPCTRSRISRFWPYVKLHTTHRISVLLPNKNNFFSW